jgi:hypothetical protein
MSKFEDIVDFDQIEQKLYDDKWKSANCFFRLICCKCLCKGCIRAFFTKDRLKSQKNKEDCSWGDAISIIVGQLMDVYYLYLIVYFALEVYELGRRKKLEFDNQCQPELKDSAAALFMR